MKSRKSECEGPQSRPSYSKKKRMTLERKREKTWGIKRKRGLRRAGYYLPGVGEKKGKAVIYFRSFSGGDGVLICWDGKDAMGLFFEEIDSESFF